MADGLLKKCYLTGCLLVALSILCSYRFQPSCTFVWQGTLQEISFRNGLIVIDNAPQWLSDELEVRKLLRTPYNTRPVRSTGELIAAIRAHLRAIQLYERHDHPIREMCAPLGVLLLPLTGPRLFLFIGSWRRRRIRWANGLCVVCGYDLRCTQGTCSECGTLHPRAIAMVSPMRLTIGFCMVVVWIVAITLSIVSYVVRPKIARLPPISNFYTSSDAGGTYLRPEPWRKIVAVKVCIFTGRSCPSAACALLPKSSSFRTCDLKSTLNPGWCTFVRSVRRIPWQGGLNFE